MKLDPRIIEGKRPLTCFDTDKAKQFIGKEGYFNNNLSRFCYLKNCVNACLKNIFIQNETCFVSVRNDWPDTDYKYFLPAEWVKEKEPEPVWRPYDLDTLKEDKIYFGDTVVFRRKTKDGNAKVITAIYNGKSENSNDLDDSEILLGGEWFGFQRLFDDYEIYDNVYRNNVICEWRPFGYQE